jgi:hypothetical protein
MKVKSMKVIRHLLTLIIVLALPLLAAAEEQDQPIKPQVEPQKEDGVGLAPARFELPMLPGTEKTVVVNIIYNAGSAEAKPFRLVAGLGDWTILNNGQVDYYKAGTTPNSAASWIIYSPGEVTIMPGKVHPVRVTISVPKDAEPGDHTAALFVESRPDNLKLDEDRKQVVVRFRLAALFYIMVPRLTREGSLQGLKAEAREQGIIVIPTLKNEGNSHIRPVHSVSIVDREGTVVAEYAESESLPVLAREELSRPLIIEKRIPPGEYLVRYKVDFKDGSPIIEGQTDLIVKQPPSNRAVAAEKNQGAKQSQ